MTPPKLILASTSPRRRELLGMLGIPFTVIGSNFDESSIPTDGLLPSEWVMRLAAGKAAEVAAHASGDSLIIGADTTVVLKEEFLNKPAGSADACRMLRKLSGQTHQVYTGVCVISAQRGQICDYGVTDVTFDEISDETIARYVATGEPLDKAGAYGIQGKALSFIPNIDGDYFNVMGLCLDTLRNMLLPFYPALLPAPAQPAFPALNYREISWEK